jgi:hypothetical protein
MTGCPGAGGCWTGVEVATGAGEEAGEEGVEGAEVAEYFTEDEETLAEKRGVGGNSALTSREDFLAL